MKKCEDCQHFRVFWKGGNDVYYKCLAYHRILDGKVDRPQEIKVPEWCIKRKRDGNI